MIVSGGGGSSAAALALLAAAEHHHEGRGDAAVCTLLGGPFAVLLQVLLAFAALSALLYKRALETPKRPPLVWAYDASKQGLGAGLVHAWNVALSIWVAKLRHDAGDDDSDECAMYFVNFTIDVLVGTVLIWALMQAQRALAKRLRVASLQHTGLYGDPPSFRVYVIQLAAYLFILVVVKTLLAFMVLALDRSLQITANTLFVPLRGYPSTELILVMVICPWLLNSCQFWVLDSVVMHRQGHEANAYKRMDNEAAP